MTTMRAVRAHSRGGADQLRLDTIPKPEPRPGEALIRVHAAGITPTELGWPETWVDREGHDRTPTIPSHEVSGVVEALGHGVTHVDIGEEVYGLVPFDHDGAAADYVAVRARDIAPKPVTLDHTRTAALPLSALTAWQAFTEQAHVRPGQHVLVHGGAGGVGAFAVQIAKALGARVSATASGGDIEYVHSLGADAVIDYKATRFEDSVSDVDVVLDPIGGKTAEASLGVLRDGGSLISLAGPPEVTLPEGRNLRARFFIVEPERAQLIELAQLVDDGRLRVEVAEVFPLEDIEAAYEFARTSHRRGKVVVQVTAVEANLNEQAVGATAG
jgi:NADPH:quinone reductase-like Zn-dependent oxidoreductase